MDVALEIPTGYSTLFEAENSASEELLAGEISTDFIPLTQEQKGERFLFHARKTLAEEKNKIRSQHQLTRTGLASKLWNYRQRQRSKAKVFAKQQAEQQISDSLLAIESKYNQIVGLASKECLTVVHKICRMVLHRELRVEDETLKRIVEHELSGLQFRRIKSIQVHPTQQKLAASFDIPVTIHDSFAEDEACIVTASGEIRISLSADLERVFNELQAMLIQQQEGFHQ